jgi:hypothetical protein
MNNQSYDEIDMYENMEPLEELRRLTRQTREYRTGVREAMFTVMDMLKRMKAGEMEADEVIERANEMFYKGNAPGQPKAFGFTRTS